MSAAAAIALDDRKELKRRLAACIALRIIRHGHPEEEARSPLEDKLPLVAREVLASVMGQFHLHYPAGLPADATGSQQISKSYQRRAEQLLEDELSGQTSVGWWHE